MANPRRPLPLARVGFPDDKAAVVLGGLIGISCSFAAPLLFMDSKHLPLVYAILIAFSYFVIWVILAYKYANKRVGVFRRQLNHWVLFFLRTFFVTISLTLTSFFNITVDGIIGYSVSTVAVFLLLMAAQLPSDAGLLQSMCVLPIQALRKYNEELHKLPHGPTTAQHDGVVRGFAMMGIGGFYMLAVQNHYIDLYAKLRADSPL